MRKFGFLAASSLMLGLLFSGLAASATPVTVSTTFTFEDALSFGPGGVFFTETSAGVTLFGGGAGGVCDSTGLYPFASISGNAVISSYCNGNYGSTFIAFDHYLTSLTLDWATDDTGLLSVAYGDFNLPAADGTTTFGSTQLCPPGPGSCVFEGTLTITGARPFNSLIFDSDQLGYPDYALDNLAVTAVLTPEPSSLALLGTGALGLLGAVRRRK